MVDAQVSGTCGRKAVKVRVLSWAPPAIVLAGKRQCEFGWCVRAGVGRVAAGPRVSEPRASCWSRATGRSVAASGRCSGSSRPPNRRFLSARRRGRGVGLRRPGSPLPNNRPGRHRPAPAASARCAASTLDRFCELFSVSSPGLWRAPSFPKRALTARPATRAQGAEPRPACAAATSARPGQDPPRPSSPPPPCAPPADIVRLSGVPPNRGAGERDHTRRQAAKASTSPAPVALSAPAPAGMPPRFSLLAGLAAPSATSRADARSTLLMSAGRQPRVLLEQQRADAGELRRRRRCAAEHAPALIRTRPVLLAVELGTRRDRQHDVGRVVRGLADQTAKVRHVPPGVDPAAERAGVVRCEHPPVLGDENPAGRDHLPHHARETRHGRCRPRTRRRCPSRPPPGSRPPAP